MSDRDSDGARADGGTVEQDIFGTDSGGDGPRRRRTAPQERLRRLIDLYLLAPLRIAWSDWRTRIGGLGLLGYILAGTVGVIFVPRPQFNEGHAMAQPFQDPALPLGTDGVGRSLFKLVIHATPNMLKMAMAGVFFSIGLAVIIGLVSGYKGGTIDAILMTFTDVVLTLPGLPLIIIIAAIYPPKDPFIVGAIVSIDSWPGLARTLRSQVWTLREESYVEASRAMGMSTTEIVGRDLVPQLAPFILISSAGAARGVISASVALYFLGILPNSNANNWGVMLNQARRAGAVYNATARHYLLVPLIALSGLMFVLILFGQGMDRVWNPRLRARHSKTTPDTAEDDT